MAVRIEAGWYALLKDVFESQEFAKLAQFVRQEYAANVVYPPARKIFAAFDYCPWDRTKVVILGQDPYHGFHQANGMAFSVDRGITIPPSLRNIFQEVHFDTKAPNRTDGDLTRWAQQGVLLLNATLTVRENAPGSHQGRGWEEFTDEVIRRISASRPHVVFMLWGAYAGRKAPLIDTSRHLVLTSPHPSPLSAHRGFFGNRHFSKANTFLTSHELDPIVW